MRFSAYVILLLSAFLKSGQGNFSIDYLIKSNDKLVRHFTNDYVTGRVYRIFQNGYHKKKYVGELIESSRDGKWTTWWDNGERKIEGTYLKGVKNGFWHEWSEDGTMISELIYKEGRVIQLKNCAYEIRDSTITNEKIIKMKKLKTK